MTMRSSHHPTVFLRLEVGPWRLCKPLQHQDPGLKSRKGLFKPRGSISHGREWKHSSTADRAPKCFPEMASSGFTLLEVLVATLVLGIAVVIILQLFSGSLDQARRAEDYTRAVFHARAKMEEALLDLPAGAASAIGDFGDGFRWVLEILPEDALPVTPSGVQPLVIRVTVGWDFDGTPNQYHLQTMALGPATVEPSS
jgi:prepilin-type N-terminal cleavage/methylation domain-containing protein